MEIINKIIEFIEFLILSTVGMVGGVVLLVLQLVLGALIIGLFFQGSHWVAQPMMWIFRKVRFYSAYNFVEEHSYLLFLYAFLIYLLYYIIADFF